MTKPHEETWKVANGSIVRDRSPATEQGTSLWPQESLADLTCDAAHAALIAQAPAMARLLLKVQWGDRSLSEPGCHVCFTTERSGAHADDCEFAAVLRSAGVLPEATP